MASLDVESLFTNISLEETIKISCDSLSDNEAKIKNFSRNDFEKLLRMAIKTTSLILMIKSINKRMG